MQRHALERIYRRTVPTSQVITPELAQFMASISREIRRQVGVLIDRRGRIAHVVVGDTHKLLLPDLGRHRAGRGRFRGLRLMHTHIMGEGITKDDLTDLALLQLDMIGVIEVSDEGRGTSLELAHLLPPGPADKRWEVLPATPLSEVELQFLRFIEDLESTFAAQQADTKRVEAETTAIAVHVGAKHHGARDPDESLAELAELAATADVEIVETVIQRRQPDPRFVLGRGKLDDLVLAAMQHDVDLIIFDRDLTPAQVRSIADHTEFKVIDRTQLILDIFAQRASTRAGKLQVELAQLKYTLPRLAGKNTAMSRLMGGIGGRGPGESKLEIDRRRAKDRIARLGQQLDKLSKDRQQRRRRRRSSQVPQASIVGYTNAGKSTLLNALTGAEVLAEDKLFATLDPTSRRLRFPDERELVLTDTVGFIRDLPPDLVTAFKATLEELAEADVLIHVVDIASPEWEQRVRAVTRVLRELEVHDKPMILVFNKAELVDDPVVLDNLCKMYDAVPASALDRKSLAPLIERLLDELSKVTERQELLQPRWERAY